MAFRLAASVLIAPERRTSLSCWVTMGLWPTRRDESRTFVTPAHAGVRPSKLDSRFRGNDVTFDGTQRSISAVRRGLLRPKGTEETVRPPKSTADSELAGDSSLNAWVLGPTEEPASALTSGLVAAAQPAGQGPDAVETPGRASVRRVFPPANSPPAGVQADAPDVIAALAAVPKMAR